MFCQRCGHQQSVANPRYCENCAQPLATTVYQVAQPNPQPGAYPTASKQTMRFIYCAAGFVVLCVFCAGLSQIGNKKNGSATPDTLVMATQTPAPNDVEREENRKAIAAITAAQSPTPTLTPTATERAELAAGPKPEAVDGKITLADLYFRLALKDYKSAEYLYWTPLELATYKKKPCWKSSVRLRAKNSFGAYVVNDHTFYFRGGEIVGVK